MPTLNTANTLNDIGADLACALDPVRLAARAGILLDPWQSQYLRSGAPRQLLNCSRQSGKSTATAIKALHKALYKPRSLSLLVSPTLRQSGELFKKVISVYGDLGRPVSPESETALTLTLENGSRIVSLPGKEGTIRGYSGVDLLAIDEAAWVPETLYLSVRPMLAVSGGDLVAVSTPYGTRGWFYEAWRGEQPWERYEVPATMCPRITPEFLEEEKENMGEWWFTQEYMCIFCDADSQAFRREDIDRAFEESVQTWAL
ncbi:MAG: terminase family protein [Armatimonadota bacterium]